PPALTALFPLLFHSSLAHSGEGMSLSFDAAASRKNNFRITRRYIRTMHVLVLTQVVVYPADAGPKVKTLQVLRYLATHHDVVYCTFVRSTQEVRDVEKLREICRRVVTVPI